MHGTYFACMCSVSLSLSHCLTHAHYLSLCIEKSAFRMYWIDPYVMIWCHYCALTTFSSWCFPYFLCIRQWLLSVQQNAHSLHIYIYNIYIHLYYHLINLSAPSGPSLARKPNTRDVYIISVYIFLAWALQLFVGFGFFNPCHSKSSSSMIVIECITTRNCSVYNIASYK